MRCYFQKNSFESTLVCEVDDQITQRNNLIVIMGGFFNDFSDLYLVLCIEFT